MSNKVLLDLPYWEKDGNKVLSTLHNVKIALLNKDICRYMAKYDNTSESVVFCDTDDNDKVKPQTEELLIELRMRLEVMFSFNPIKQNIMRDAALFVAKHNCIN